MQDFRQLIVWQKAPALTVSMYRTVDRVPRNRSFTGWRSQMLRAASSISSNTAEGCGHRTDRELLRYVAIAFASATELQNHLILARDLTLISTERFEELDDRLVEVRRMLTGFDRGIRRQPERHDRA